jgi:hypothetical protein
LQITDPSERHVRLLKEAATEITENIWTLRSFLTREMNFSREDIDVQFGIDEDALEEI